MEQQHEIKNTKNFQITSAKKPYLVREICCTACAISLTNKTNDMNIDEDQRRNVKATTE